MGRSRRIAIRFSAGTTDFFLSQSVQSSSAAHPASYSVVLVARSTWTKRLEREADHSTTPCRWQEWTEPNLQAPIHLHDKHKYKLLLYTRGRTAQSMI